MEKTLVLIKPDAVKRKLMGEIISIYEKNDLHITAIKIIKPSEETAKLHYFEHKDKPFFLELVRFITSGEVCAIIIEGENVIGKVRKINGATDPSIAEEGTIRRRFALSKSENCVHSSDSKESAEREMKIWFPENLVLQPIH
ncbi:MAG: nucleoside-diphosphate kinase [Sedimentibacter sp.]